MDLPKHGRAAQGGCRWRGKVAGQAKSVLRRISKYVEKNFENVGKKFYKEVKKSQAGKRDEKFYGTPSDEEVNKLLDEGVDLFHVPKVKDN